MLHLSHPQLSQRFLDRSAAGRLLAERVVGLNPIDPVVLALPRGGVPVGVEVAHALNAPMDLMLVSKIGSPDRPDLALAAVSEGGSPQIVLNRPVYGEAQVKGSWLVEAVNEQLHEMERRKAKYLPDAQRPSMDGHTVILVDDGLATGTSMRAALKAVSHVHPRRIIVAVPVAPLYQLAVLQGEANDIVCLAAPDSFDAVGTFYEDFHPLSDDEVVDWMKQVHQDPGDASDLKT